MYASVFPLPWNFRQANHPRETDNRRHDDGGARPHENGAPQESYPLKGREAGGAGDRILDRAPERQGTSRKLSAAAIRQDELLIPPLRVGLRQAENFCRQ